MGGGFSTALCSKGLNELPEEISAFLMRLQAVSEPLCSKMLHSSIFFLSEAQVNLPECREELCGCNNLSFRGNFKLRELLTVNFPLIILTVGKTLGVCITSVVGKVCQKSAFTYYRHERLLTLGLLMISLNHCGLILRRALQWFLKARK